MFPCNFHTITSLLKILDRGLCWEALSSMFYHHLCAASSGGVLLALFNYGRGKGVRFQHCRRCRPSSSSSPLGCLCFCCWGSLLVVATSVAEGEESRASNPPMSSSKSVFFLPAAGSPLFKSPVLVELSFLNNPWSILPILWIQNNVPSKCMTALQEYIFNYFV